LALEVLHNEAVVPQLESKVRLDQDMSLMLSFYLVHRGRPRFESSELSGTRLVALVIER
jgi:hypothetical protein